MFTRTLAAFVVLFVLTSEAIFSQQPTEISHQKPTGTIIVKMSGELAREYAKITGPINGDGIPGNLNISTTAVIAQRLPNNQVRIEHSGAVKGEGRRDRLVTLTTTVDEKDVRWLVRTVFDGGFTFSNSSRTKTNGESSAVTADHFAIPFLSLADLNGVKLQTWTLESEISE